MAITARARGEANDHRRMSLWSYTGAIAAVDRMRRYGEDTFEEQEESH